MAAWEKPPRTKWGRLNENNQIVEFTFVDPLGRYHPDLKWVEVEWDTKLYTTITIFGSEVIHDPNSIIGETDENKMYEEWVKMEKEALEEANTFKEPTISDYTVNIEPD